MISDDLWAGRTSDTFVELDCSGQRQHTSTVRRSLHPTWNETLEMRFRAPPEHLVMRLWDHHLFKASDPLGFVHVRHRSSPLIAPLIAIRSVSSMCAIGAPL